MLDLAPIKFRYKVVFFAKTNTMGYFNYHATAKKLITDGKLKNYYFVEKHNGISPALILVFDDATHPVMPIREHRWAEYLNLIDKIESKKQTTRQK